ncbi:MAG TPA: hypothetical protein HA230_00265 [Candidatus Aenigmarchaeota archaeon]|nr:hypothetical protein [Candidatus Aenigmarchaeota archaeon]
MKIKSNTVYVLLAVFIVITVFNSYMLFSLGTTQHTSTRKTVKLTGDPVQDAINTIIPTGAAEPYGSALGVSFDDPVAGLSVLANLHRQIPTDSLSAEEKQRYINIGTKISCEFCCSAPAVVDSSGRDLCGCAHAQSFMGLSKYLIQNNPEMSDEDILWELTRWKSLYYPRNMVEKAAAALENGLELTPEVLNDRDLLSKISSGNTADIGSLPQMVGGC